MATAHSPTEHDDTEHAGAARYWLTWGALLGGTIATLVMSRVHLPHPWNLLVALFIASVKSALVVLFFMHLYDHGGANRLVFVTSVFFVVLLIGIVVLDNATRFSLLNPGHDEATMRMLPPGPDPMAPGQPPGEAGPKSSAPARRE